MVLDGSGSVLDRFWICFWGYPVLFKSLNLEDNDKEMLLFALNVGFFALNVGFFDERKRRSNCVTFCCLKDVGKIEFDISIFRF